MMTSQVEMRPKASIRVLSIFSPWHGQETNRQRHAQQLAKDQMDGDGCQRGEGKRKPPARAERRRRGVNDQRRGDDEAEPVGGRDVEQQQRRRQQGTQPVKLAAWRRGFAALERNDLLFFLEGVTYSKRDREAAKRKPGSDHKRKHVGTDRLPGYRREEPAAIGRGRAESNQKQSRDTIGKVHERAPLVVEPTGQVLASPAAFIATPIAASPLSMKLANSPASPHTVPKPRLLMKSLNSLDSKTFFSDAVSFAATSAGRSFGPAMPRHAPVA